MIIDEARDTGEGLDTKQLGADILYHICLNFVGWSVLISSSGQIDLYVQIIM